MEIIKTDFAVVGLGAVGASTLYQLAKRGVNVVGIDRYSPPHRHGSSHGHGRVTRSAVGEGPAYVPLVRRSQEIVRELERMYQVELMARTGTLIIGPSNEQFLRRTTEIALENKIAHHIFDSKDLKRLYPQLIGLTGDDYGYFEQDAGFLLPEAVVNQQICAALNLGANLLVNATVDRVWQENGVVRIRIGLREVQASHAVVAAGCWTGKMMGEPFDRLLTVKRQRTFSFRPDGSCSYGQGQLPTLMWFRSDAEGECITVFPQVSQDGGVGFFVEGKDEDGAVAKLAGRFFERQVRPYFNGVSRHLVGSDPCKYTQTPDHGFIIDRHPDLDRLVVVSACSGHGFKHSLAAGEIAAQLATCGPTIDIGRFALKRLID